ERARNEDKVPGPASKVAHEGSCPFWSHRRLPRHYPALPELGAGRSRDASNPDPSLKPVDTDRTKQRTPRHGGIGSFPPPVLAKGFAGEFTEGPPSAVGKSLLYIWVGTRMTPLIPA